MWTYQGTYPGLTIRRPTGQTTNVTFTNNLNPAAGELTVHNHGNHSSSEKDGQPDNFLIGTGASMTYVYDGLEDGGNERGATQWYHDHRDMVTGLNVWMGLAGLYIIDDPADPATLPSGAFELPLTIADRQFDANNQIPYVFDSGGVFGENILVNGVYQPYFDVGDRKYRLRILNASNARIYNLRLSTGDSFTQIGTESGLLPAPLARADMRMGPAERMDVVVDFAGRLGQDVYLTDTLSGAQLLKFRVTQQLPDGSTIPATLRALPDIGEPTVTRNFSFDETAGHWTINGLGFDPNRIDAQPVLGTTEKWVLTNPTSTTHMVHLHDVDQQCLSRDGVPCYPYETMKETWYLGPGETLELKLKFTDHIGKYIFHCHILEHEDDGMMSQFEVVAPTINISGNVTYCPGSPRPVQDVALNLTGDTTTSTLSDGSGNYQFSSLASGGSYTVTPSRSNLPPGLGTNGINTADAQLVQKHFQSGGTLLTGCALTAARTNANNLGDPNTSDALFIQQFFLFSPNPLPGANRAGQWRFTPANRTYANVTSNRTGQNYDAYALGDVNGDLTIPAGPSDSPAMTVSVAAVPVAVTKVALPNVDTTLSEFVAAVTTSKIAARDKLVAFQGDFTFDSRVVTFQSMPVARAGLTASGNWALAANVLGTGTLKTLRVSCFALDANSVLSGEGPLFELRMTRGSSKPGARTQLIWAEAPNSFMFLDDNVQWRAPASTPPGRVTALRERK